MIDAGGIMSSEALKWAFPLTVGSSSEKLTLLALCDFHHHKTGLIFASIAAICSVTEQNRKTVIANIGSLRKAGLIVDTLERRGRTRQVVVYRPAMETVPKAEPYQNRNDTENGPEESQKRDGQESQKRDTEPSEYEPSKEPSKRESASGDAPSLTPEHILERWNQIAVGMDKPVALTISKGRKRALSALIAEQGTTGWQLAFDKIEASDFLRRIAWLNLDWLAKPENFRKLIEGNYDQDSAGAGGGKLSTLEIGRRVADRLSGFDPNNFLDHTIQQRRERERWESSQAPKVAIC